MLVFRRAAWIAIAGFFVLGVIGSGALAAPANDAKIGVVDSQKVYKEAPRIKQYQEQLDGFKKTLSDKLELRAQNLMLNAQEMDELLTLKTKESPTDADKKRITDLTDIERKKDDELKSLQQVTTPTDQQKARLKELMDIQQKSKDTGAALLTDYDNQYKSKMQELQGKIDGELQAAVAKVADSKGLTLVLDKAAVMIGGTDISDAIIAALDRK